MTKIPKTEAFLMRYGNSVVGILAVIVVLGIVFGANRAHAEPYIEFGAGWNGTLFGEALKWDNGGAGLFGATIEAGYEWDVPKNDNLKVKCRYLHVSQWTVGPPFNNNAESSLDHFGCAVRIGFGK